MRYSVSVATKNIEFRMRSQAIQESTCRCSSDTKYVYISIRVCVYV